MAEWRARRSIWRSISSGLVVPFDLIEISQRAPSRPDAVAVGGELLGRDLAERVLHAEIRDVDVLLVDDRGDPRVDLDHVLADELDVEEVVEAKLRDDSRRGIQQSRAGQGLEVHREVCTHCLPPLRNTLDQPDALPGPVKTSA